MSNRPATSETRPATGTLAESIRAAARTTTDPAVRAWLKRLAAGEGTTGTTAKRKT